MVHKVDIQILTRFVLRDKDTYALQTGKTVTYAIYKEDNTLVDSGNMAELGSTAIYYKAWIPNAVGWWIFVISCSDPVANDVLAYFVESGVEKDIKDLLEDGTYGLAKLVRTTALSTHDTDIKTLLAAIQTDLDNPNQYKADVSALALQSTVTQYNNYKADVSALALEATLTAIKGGGWSGETLKTIYDLIVGLNDLAQSDILSDATPFAGGNIVLIKTETDKIPSLLMESQSHPTLAEIEGSSVLALKTHLVHGTGNITPPSNKGIWDYLPDIATIKTYLESGGAIYDFIDEVESLLKNATYGLNALKNEIDANETKIDGIKTETDQLPNWRFSDHLPTSTVVDSVASASETNLTSADVTPTFPTGATRQRAIIAAFLHCSNQSAATHKIGLTLQININAEGWQDVRDLTVNPSISLVNVDGVMATFAIAEDVTSFVDTSGETVEFRWQVDSDNAGEVHYTSNFVLTLIYSM